MDIGVMTEAADRHAAEAVVRDFPLHPIVSGHRIELGDRWDDELGIWVYLYTPAQERPSDTDAGAISAMVLDLSAEMRRAVPHRRTAVLLVAAPDPG